MMLKSEVACVALLALAGTALAADPPSAGAQLQQIPPAPVPQRAVPDIVFQPGNGPSSAPADNLKFQVNALHVSGQVLYSEAELIALTGFVAGSQMTLSELRAMAASIAAYYNRNGYFLAQAFLPAQQIIDGVVTITVLEGRYGSVTLHNESILVDSLPNGLLEGLGPGDPIAIAPLENRLLLLSDIPGVNVRSTLVPGNAVGTSDLMVDVTPGQRVTGSLEADNAGSRYTGEIRVGGSVYLNDPTGHGDQLGLRVLTSGSGLSYGRAFYQMQFGRAKVGVAYTALSYRLGREFANLQANGTAHIASVYAGYPLIRSRNDNLYALVDFDIRTYQDRVDSTGTLTDKRAWVWTASLYGDHRDRLGGGGENSYSLGWSFGRMDILTPAAQAAVAATSQASGNYQKLAFAAARLQRVTDSVSLYGSVNGQLASKNLDISEKMSLGGAYAVRAYPVGEAYGDQGYVLDLEARLLLPKFSERMPGRVHLVGFVDSGTVTLNKSPWTPGSNSRTLSGIGVGVTWSDYNDFAINAYYARKLGNEVAISAPDSAGRFWIQLVKYF